VNSAGSTSLRSTATTTREAVSSSCPGGALVFDLHDRWRPGVRQREDFERITQARYPAFFNSNHTENNLEGRSDDKGPEPEGITVAELA
jgi:hypothetical protein